MPISVVVPAYNEETGIVECLERLIRQGHAVSEIIVVDNNSTDATADLVAEIAHRDPRVRIIDEARPGVSFARYAGFDAASEDLIASIDCDTAVLDGWADAIERTFDHHGHIEAGGAPMIMHDLPFQKRYLRRQMRRSTTGIRMLAAGGTPTIPALSGANSVLRARAWHKIRDRVSYRRDIFEDLDRSLHLQEAGLEIALIPGMNATVSGRRLLSGPREFLRYAACGPRTYRLHGRNRMALVALATGFTTVVRVTALLPVNRAWDPQTCTFSMRQLRSHDRLRESPIKAGLV